MHEFFGESLVFSRSCHVGYEFQDHTSIRTFECIGQDIIYGINETCESNLQFHFFIIFLITLTFFMIKPGINCSLEENRFEVQEKSDKNYIQSFQYKCSKTLDLISPKICQSLPYWPLINVNLNRIGDNAILKCKKGYHFKNGLDSINLKCTFGQWNFSNLSQCEGKKLLFFFYFFFL